jgi:hypothetical protein
MAQKEHRTIESVTQIKLAFWGAICNLRVLEDAFLKIERIPLYQYANYVSQLAFCVELGFKSMIINTDDFEQIHDLEKLFSMTPEVFQTKFKSMCHDDMDFSASLSKTKNVFTDFRYMKFDRSLKEYLDERVIDDNITINFKEIGEIEQFCFLRMLLEKIFEYENFIREEALKRKKALKSMQNPDIKDVDGIVSQYIEMIKEISPCIVLVNKSE